MRVVCAMLIALSAAACDRGSAAERRRPEVLGEVPFFSLTDQRGETVRTDDLSGHVWVVNFIFTRCPTVCPVTTRKLKRIGERVPEVGLVSFSVDPEHDTPAVLAEFAAQHGATTASNWWRFLTGPAEDVERAVEDGFKIALERRGETGGVPDLVHGVHFVLVDRFRRIRGYYDSDSAERLDDLVADAEAVLKEGGK